MWFGSTDGDLYIKNLRLEDGGSYVCHFSGFEEKTVQLSVKGMFNLPPFAQFPVLMDKVCIFQLCIGSCFICWS